jgi:hypothetical protein
MSFPLRLIVIFVAVGAGVFGQGAAVPPPEIDKALRERAAQFMQYTMDRTYSKAYAFVADDDKDWYLSSGKPQYTKFEIESIEYADGFQTATVKTKVTRVLSMNGHDMNTDLVVAYLWKIADGKWMWYHDPDVLDTPFGPVRIDRTLPPAGTRGGGPVPKDMSQEAASKAAGNLKLDATTDKKELLFEEGQLSDQELIFHNGLSGIVRVEADIIGDYRAYSVEPSDIQVQPGADLKLHVHYKPLQNSIDASVRLVIEPFNRTLIVPLKYKTAPTPAP